MVWLPKIKGEKNIIPLWLLNLAQQVPSLGNGKPFFPSSHNHGSEEHGPIVRKQVLGEPISNFQDDGRKSNQTNQTRIFFSKSGGAFFWFTDFKSSEDSPRLGYPIKMPLSLGMKKP